MPLSGRELLLPLAADFVDGGLPEQPGMSPETRRKCWSVRLGCRRRNTKYRSRSAALRERCRAAAPVTGLVRPRHNPGDEPRRVVSTCGQERDLVDPDRRDTPSCGGRQRGVHGSFAPPASGRPSRHLTRRQPRRCRTVVTDEPYASRRARSVSSRPLPARAGRTFLLVSEVQVGTRALAPPQVPYYNRHRCSTATAWAGESRRAVQIRIPRP